MTKRPLDCLFSPRSVAVIGASRTAGTIGNMVFQNLIRGGFEGPVYPVNPNAEYVASVRTWPSVESIPDDIELAVILLPARLVLEAVEACGRKGVASLVVVSAGFGELEEGRAREAAVVRRVRELGMRMVGPNCLGILNTDPGVRLNATFAPNVPPPGSVAFSSQSGALGVAILDTARQLGIGVSEFASVGNKADVSGNDLLEHWERDERTDVILLYLESFGNPRRFASTARRVSRAKPIVAVKSGRTADGARAASSHTGALAASDRSTAALFDHTGVIRVNTVEELFDTAMLLANQPLPKGKRVGIVSNAGGPGVLCTDACVARGLELARFAPETVAALGAILPAEAALHNPVDMIASAGKDDMGRCLDAVLSDPGVDAAIALYVPPGHANTTEVAKVIVRASDLHEDKPLLSCFMGTHGVPDALHSLRRGHVPSYAFPEAAAQALARAVGYARWLERPVGVRPTLPPADLRAARAALERVDPDGWLPGDAVAALLEAYGIPHVATKRATTVKEAVGAAGAVGYPVVMKAEADGLVHKSDRGGVKLGLRTAGEVAAAFTEMEEGFGESLRAAVLQPMLDGAVEVIVGAMQDEAFGPLMMFGLGGVQVELFKDVAFALHPLTDADASRLIDSVQAARLLFGGFRGRPPVDRAALLDLLARLGQLIDETPALAELDLNPVLMRPEGEGLCVVDARIRLNGTSRTEPA